MTWVKVSPPFCKYTDFVGEILIPNLTTTGPVGPGNIVEVERFITKYEKRLLVSLLGTEGYTTFVAAMIKDEPDALDIALYNMLFVDEKPVANFIYYWWMRNNASMTAGISEVKPNAENAIAVNNSTKMCRAWNEFSEYIEPVIDHLELNEVWYECISVGLVSYSDLLVSYAPINTMNV